MAEKRRTACVRPEKDGASGRKPDEALPLVQQWYKKEVGKTKPEEYERQIVENFATDGKPDILIVVDKLLTGFDEPRNAVLYIDKPLEGHNIIQAIARVNRLHPAKQYGMLIDYRGILSKLDTAIEQYQDLQTKTQQGYDIDDINSMYHQVNTEYKRLPTLHETLWSFFNQVDNKQDLEQYRKILTPQFENEPGEEGSLFDIKQKLREDFYQALTDFGMCLKIALASRAFYEDGAFNEKTISTYKRDLAFFINLRKIARQDAGETVDYSEYEDQIRRLVDKQVVGESITVANEHYLVDELGKIHKAVRLRAKWIFQHITQIKERQKHILKREYVSGETIFYLGRRYMLKVINLKRGAIKDTPERVKLLGSYVKVWIRPPALLTVNADSSIELSTTCGELGDLDALKAARRQKVKVMLKDWFREHARLYFSKRLTVLATSISWLPEMPLFKLQNMKKQWGSCSPVGTLLLNPLLVKAPRQCIDYVLLHEICHLREHNHSKKFYTLLNSLMPDWGHVKKRLDDMAELLLNE